MFSELQAILGPELLPMLLVNGIIALFALSLMILTLFRTPERSAAPIVVRI